MNPAGRILSLVLTAVMIAGACCLMTGALGFLRGDADGDGDVTVADAVLVQRLCTGLTEDSDGMIARRGLVTGEEELSVLDATLIQRYATGFDNLYHIGEEIIETQPADEPTEQATQAPTQQPTLKPGERELPIIH